MVVHDQSTPALGRQFDFKFEGVGVFQGVFQAAELHVPLPRYVLYHGQDGRQILKIFDRGLYALVQIIKHDGIFFIAPHVD